MSITAERPPQVTPPEEKSEIAGFRDVLKNRNFLLLWLAQLISLTVLNAANFGIIVLVNDITHSVVMAGLAIIAFTLPGVPFSAIGGVVVDRLDKRSVLWVSNILRMITMLLVVVSLLNDRNNLWPLYVLTFVTALIGQFFTPAEAASIPLLIGERELVPALSLFNITMTLAQAIGLLILGRIVATIFPPFTLSLGALVLHVQSIDMLFVVVAFFYLVCAVLIFYIPGHAFHTEADQSARGAMNRPLRTGQEDIQQPYFTWKDRGSSRISALWQTVQRDAVEGWRFVRSDRLLFFSVVQLSAMGVIVLMIGEFAGMFVQQILHRPVEDMSLIFMPAAVGLIGASLLMPRIAGRIERMRLTVIGFIVAALGIFLLPVSPWLSLQLDPVHGLQNPLVTCATVCLTFLIGTAIACITVPTQVVLQERSPETVRGRVFAFQSMVYNAGSIPVLLFAGIIGQFIGLNQLIVLVTVSMLLFCWWGTRFRRIQAKRWA
jgi:MFS family permease